MSDVIYISYTNLARESHLYIPNWRESLELSKLEPGHSTDGPNMHFIAHVDFGAQRYKERSPVWVRVVCQTRNVLTETEKKAIAERARRYAVNDRLIVDEGL